MRDSLANESAALSVVIPMHNSSSVVEETVLAWLGRTSDSITEVIIVENGSRDDTWQRVNELAIDSETVRFVLLQSEKGMGNALRAGIAASTGERVLLSADDLPFGFDDVDAAAQMTRIPPIVIGSKAHPDSVVERGFARGLFTWGYRFLRFVVLGSRVGDTQGTILADGDWLRGLAPYLDEGGFLFTTQLIVFAEDEGLEILEVPVRLRRTHAPEESTVRISDIIEMGNGLARLKRSSREHKAAAGVSLGIAG